MGSASTKCINSNAVFLKIENITTNRNKRRKPRSSKTC